MQKSISAKEISAIIKACGSAGVTELRYGDLHLKFGARSTEIDQANTSYTQYQNSQVLKPQDESNLAPIQDPPLSDDEYDAILAIENPSEWERRQLEDSDNG